MPTDPRSAAAVGRLYEALRDALGRRPGAGGRSEVTVSEIYQTLVPYARARADLGFEMNADYEHALMRLLAGEGGFARLEQSEARAHLARELASANPDVTLYRKFAASTLRLAEPVAASPTPAGTSRADTHPRAATPSEPAGERIGESGIRGGASGTGGGASAGDDAAPDPTPAPGGPGNLPGDAPRDPDPGARHPASVSWSQALDRIAQEGPPRPVEESAERALDDGLARLSSVIHGGREERGRVEARPEGAPERLVSAGGLRVPDQELAPARRGSEPGEATAPDAGAAADARADESDPYAAPASRRAGVLPEECGSCGRDLPTDREARFCPYCGSEQPRVCAGCGDSLEAEWRFCPSCGSEV